MIQKSLTIIAVGIFFLCANDVRAVISEEFDNYMAQTSCVKATNGLTLAISIFDTRFGTNTTELPIGLIFKAPTNTESMLFQLKNEYIARLGLYDAGNRPIAKTKLGLEYGRKLNDVYWNIKKFSDYEHAPTRANDTWSGGIQWLPKTSELFALKEPGTYRLKVEAQVMVEYLDMKKKQTRQIVRFPPVEIIVTRPSPAGASK